MFSVPLRTLTPPGSPELNVHRFFKQVEAELGSLEHGILEHLVDAGTTRGWFPSASQLVDRFAEHWPEAEVTAALQRLVAARAIELDGSGTIVGTVSGVTTRRTGLSGAAEGIKFNLRSVLDALTIAPTLQKPVVVTTRCPETQEEIKIVFAADGSIQDLLPAGAAAFVPGWDGVAPLAEALTAGGFFANDHALEAWENRNPSASGTPLGGDTLRFIGPELAASLAASYVHMSVR